MLITFPQLKDFTIDCADKDISDTSFLTFPVRKQKVQAACRPVTVQMSRPSDYHFDIGDTEQQTRRN